MFRFKWRWGLLAIFIATMFLGTVTVTSSQTTKAANGFPTDRQEQLAFKIDNSTDGDSLAQSLIGPGDEYIVANVANTQTNTTATTALVGNTVGLSRSSPVAYSPVSGSAYNRLSDKRLAWEVRHFNDWVVNAGLCGPPYGYANSFATMIASTAFGGIGYNGSDNMGAREMTGILNMNAGERSSAWLGSFSDYGGGVPQVGDGNIFSTTLVTLATTAAGTGTTFSGVAASQAQKARSPSLMTYRGGPSRAASRIHPGYFAPFNCGDRTDSASVVLLLSSVAAQAGTSVVRVYGEPARI